MGSLPEPLGRSSAARFESVPEHVGGYRVDGLLGRGSSGLVLRVHDTNLDRPMALKLLFDELDEEARARFLIEARAAARIIHPNVVQVYSVGTHDGLAFITQELVDGHPLSDLLEVRERLSPGAVVDIGLQAARGLARAAQVQVIHRDVKPHNLLVTEDGTVKLADFGLAKLLNAPSSLTDRGTTLGTPHYMSPEQGQGQPDLDPRSDQYSLGATLYHLITGVPPFDSENVLALLLKHVNEPLVPVCENAPECPEALAKIIERMLEKDREARFASFDDVVEALEDVELEDAEAEAAEEHKEILEAVGEVVARATRERTRADEDGSAGAEARGPKTEVDAAVPDAPRASLVDRVALFGGIFAAAAIVFIVLAGGEGVQDSDPTSVSAPPSVARPTPVRAPMMPSASKKPATARDPFSKHTSSAETGAVSAKVDRPAPKAVAPAKRAPPKLSRRDRLIRMLDDSPERAVWAAEALGRARDQSATPALIEALRRARDPRVAVAAADALGSLGDLRALEPLEEAAKRSGSARVRSAAEAAKKRLWSVEPESGSDAAASSEGAGGQSEDEVSKTDVEAGSGAPEAVAPSGTD